MTNGADRQGKCKYALAYLQDAGAVPASSTRRRCCKFNRLDQDTNWTSLIRLRCPGATVQICATNRVAAPAERSVNIDEGALICQRNKGRGSIDHPAGNKYHGRQLHWRKHLRERR